MDSYPTYPSSSSNNREDYKGCTQQKPQNTRITAHPIDRDREDGHCKWSADQCLKQEPLFAKTKGIREPAHNITRNKTNQGHENRGFDGACDVNKREVVQHQYANLSLSRSFEKTATPASDI